MSDAVHAPHRWRNIAVLTGAAVLAIAVFEVRPRHAEHASAFETVVVDRGPIRAKVTATGTVNPIVQVQVGAQVSGTIQALGADFNSEVEPGQMIAQIDPRLFNAAVAVAQANLQSARAQTQKDRAALVDTRRIAMRNHELFDQKLLAQATVDTADTAVDTGRATVAVDLAAEAQATAALGSAELSLAYSTIRSPIRGTVITRNIDIGQTVAASFSAPLLFLIGEDLTKMEVDTNIAEADVGGLAAGQTATFTVDAYPARVFSGKIRQVRASPQVVQNVVTYNAVIDVANPKRELLPGMTANIEVITAERGDAIRVPNAAVRFRPSAEVAGAQPKTAPLGKKLVWVLRGGAVEPVVFEPGVSDGTYTEVLGGLSVGDVVIAETIASGAAAPRIL